LLALAAGVRGAVAGMAIGYALATAYTFLAALPHRRGVAIAFSLRSVARASIGIACAIFALNVLLLFDIVLAKRYLDAHTAGLYGAAALSGRVLYAVTAFVPTVLLPQAAGRMARGSRTRGLYLQAIGAGIVICLAVVSLFALFPGFIITTIAGRVFASGAPFVFPYVYAMAALSLANITTTYNIARGKMRFVVPLAIVAIGEITAVAIRHRTADDLLQTIAIGHTLAFLACTVSLGGSSRGAQAEQPRRAM
jgi:O-antigen/teichoic acid export membrane protein